MKDLLLTPYGDLSIGQNGDIAITESPAQAARLRLRWVLGEWKFDPSKGVPYFEEVFVKNPNPARIEQIIAEHLRAVDGITKVISVTSKWGRENRILSISFEAEADGQKISEEVSVNA